MKNRNFQELLNELHIINHMIYEKISNTSLCELLNQEDKKELYSWIMKTTFEVEYRIKSAYDIVEDDSVQCQELETKLRQIEPGLARMLFVLAGILADISI